MTEWYENELLGVCYQKVSEQTQWVSGGGGGEKGGMPAAEDMQPSLKIKISDRISAPAPSPTL